MAQGQREIRRELREVRLQRGSHSSGGEADVPAAGPTPEPSVPPLGGRTGGSAPRARAFKVPTASAAPRARLLHISPAKLSESAALPPGTANLADRAPGAVLPCPANLGADGPGGGWAMAAAVQDRVAQEAGAVLAAVDTVTGEVAGMVSNLCGRAAEVSSSVARARRGASRGPEPGMAPTFAGADRGEASIPAGGSESVGRRAVVPTTALASLAQAGSQSHANPVGVLGLPVEEAHHDGVHGNHSHKVKSQDHERGPGSCLSVDLSMDQIRRWGYIILCCCRWARLNRDGFVCCSNMLTER